MFGTYLMIELIGNPHLTAKHLEVLTFILLVGGKKLPSQFLSPPPPHPSEASGSKIRIFLFYKLCLGLPYNRFDKQPHLTAKHHEILTFVLLVCVGGGGEKLTSQFLPTPTTLSKPSES